ncbi:MAG: Yip1 family protein, partial [Candidatus Omnitrophota bacterium]|nr:Yip1 family protein [Candidatus Omnitrophota bacterium]
MIGWFWKWAIKKSWEFWAILGTQHSILALDTAQARPKRRIRGIARTILLIALAAFVGVTTTALIYFGGAELSAAVMQQWQHFTALIQPHAAAGAQGPWQYAGVGFAGLACGAPQGKFTVLSSASQIESPPNLLSPAHIHNLWQWAIPITILIFVLIYGFIRLNKEPTKNSLYASPSELKEKFSKRMARVRNLLCNEGWCQEHAELLTLFLWSKDGIKARVFKATSGPLHYWLEVEKWGRWVLDPYPGLYPLDSPVYDSSGGVILEPNSKYQSLYKGTPYALNLKREVFWLANRLLAKGKVEEAIEIVSLDKEMEENFLRYLKSIITIVFPDKELFMLVKKAIDEIESRKDGSISSDGPAGGAGRGGRQGPSMDRHYILSGVLPERDGVDLAMERIPARLGGSWSRMHCHADNPYLKGGSRRDGAAAAGRRFVKSCPQALITKSFFKREIIKAVNISEIPKKTPSSWKYEIPPELQNLIRQTIRQESADLSLAERVRIYSEIRRKNMKKRNKELGWYILLHIDAIQMCDLHEVWDFYFEPNEVERRLFEYFFEDNISFKRLVSDRARQAVKDYIALHTSDYDVWRDAIMHLIRNFRSISKSGFLEKAVLASHLKTCLEESGEMGRCVRQSILMAQFSDAEQVDRFFSTAPAKRIPRRAGTIRTLIMVRKFVPRKFFSQEIMHLFAFYQSVFIQIHDSFRSFWFASLLLQEEGMKRSSGFVDPICPDWLEREGRHRGCLSLPGGKKPQKRAAAPAGRSGGENIDVSRVVTYHEGRQHISAREAVNRLVRVRRAMGFSGPDGDKKVPEQHLGIAQALFDLTKPGEKMLVAGAGGDYETVWLGLIFGLDSYYTDIKPASVESYIKTTTKYASVLRLPNKDVIKGRVADIERLKTDIGLDQVRVFVMTNVEHIFKPLNPFENSVSRETSDKICREQIIPLIDEGSIMILTPIEAEAIGRALPNNMQLISLPYAPFETRIGRRIATIYSVDKKGGPVPARELSPRTVLESGAAPGPDPMGHSPAGGFLASKKCLLILGAVPVFLFGLAFMISHVPQPAAFIQPHAAAGAPNLSVMSSLGICCCMTGIQRDYRSASRWVNLLPKSVLMVLISSSILANLPLIFTSSSFILEVLMFSIVILSVFLATIPMVASNLSFRELWPSAIILISLYTFSKTTAVSLSALGSFVFFVSFLIVLFILVLAYYPVKRLFNGQGYFPKPSFYGIPASVLYSAILVILSAALAAFVPGLFHPGNPHMHQVSFELFAPFLVGMALTGPNNETGEGKQPVAPARQPQAGVGGRDRFQTCPYENEGAPFAASAPAGEVDKVVVLDPEKIQDADLDSLGEIKVKFMLYWPNPSKEPEISWPQKDLRRELKERLDREIEELKAQVNEWTERADESLRRREPIPTISLSFVLCPDPQCNLLYWRLVHHPYLTWFLPRVSGCILCGTATRKNSVLEQIAAALINGDSRTGDVLDDVGFNIYGLRFQGGQTLMPLAWALLAIGDQCKDHLVKYEEEPGKVKVIAILFNRMQLNLGRPTCGVRFSAAAGSNRWFCQGRTFSREDFVVEGSNWTDLSAVIARLGDSGTKKYGIGFQDQKHWVGGAPVAPAASAPAGPQGELGMHPGWQWLHDPLDRIGLGGLVRYGFVPLVEAPIKQLARLILGQNEAGEWFANGHRKKRYIPHAGFVPVSEKEWLGGLKDEFIDLSFAEDRGFNGAYNKVLAFLSIPIPCLAATSLVYGGNYPVYAWEWVPFPVLSHIPAVIAGCFAAVWAHAKNNWQVCHGKEGVVGMASIEPAAPAGRAFVVFSWLGGYLARTGRIGGGLPEKEIEQLLARLR